MTPPTSELRLRMPIEAADEIANAICHMDKSKSSGSDGHARGHSLKGPFLANDLLLIQEAVRNRLKRLEIVGSDVGLFTGYS